MKRTICLSIFLLLIIARSISQTTQFSIEQPSIKDLPEIELANKGKLHWSKSQIEFTVRSGLFPKGSIFHFAQPITSMRKTEPVATSVSYTYSVPDSIIRMVEYDWIIFNSNDSTKAENIFQHNTQEFIRIFGNSGKTRIEDREGLKGKITNWENDKAKVALDLGTISPEGYNITVDHIWK